MMPSVDISILIASYNSSHYLEKSISSCLNLLPSNISFEILVIDDGSTDHSQKYLQSVVHPLITAKVWIPNSGIEIAINTLVKLSQAKYICRLDADDVLDPFFLKNLPDLHSSNIDVIYGDYNVIDSNDNFIRHQQLPNFEPEEIFSRGDFLASGTLYLRDTFLAFGGYNIVNKNCGLENYELTLKLLLSRAKFMHITQPLFSYRMHDFNLSLQRRQEILKYGQFLYDQLKLGKYSFGPYHPWS